jgi:CheY-like chemotaxis protein
VLLMLPPVESDEVREQFKALGIVHTINKPIVPSRLLNAVLRALHPTGKKAATPIEQMPDRPVHPLTVLVVEDNDVNMKLSVYLLENMGHKALRATNGRKALDILARDDVDAVLMDIQMPVMNGIETTRIIREQEADGRRHLPIAALTAHAMRGDRDRCLKNGMDTYIAKPVHKQDLQHFLARYVNQELDMPNVSAENNHHNGTTVAPTDNNEPAAGFDRQDLMERLDNDTDFMISLVDIFLENAETQLEELKHELDARHFEQAERLAHTLKGGAANISASVLRQTAGDIEAAAKAGAYEQAMEGLQQIYGQITRLQDEIDKEKTRHQP